jgi:crossover junction endodeoxyribonuclease RuvC
MTGTKRILGIDPGFDRTGFGVVDMRGSDAVWVHHECLQTSADDDFAQRLQHVRNKLHEVIDIYKPSAVAIEQLFFQSNAKTAIKVGMARGVMFLVLADAGLPIVEMTPNQVKNGLTGWGNADKKQVQEMVKRFLKLTDIPRPDDAADALAIAIVGGLMAR